MYTCALQNASLILGRLMESCISFSLYTSLNIDKSDDTEEEVFVFCILQVTFLYSTSTFSMHGENKFKVRTLT